MRRQEKGKERKGTLFHMGLFSVVWRADSFGSIFIKFGTVVGVDDVISRMEGVKLFSKNSNLYDHDTSTSQIDKETENLPWQYRALRSIARY